MSFREKFVRSEFPERNSRNSFHNHFRDGLIHSFVFSWQEIRMDSQEQKESTIYYSVGVTRSIVNSGKCAWNLATMSVISVSAESSKY